MTIHLSDSHTCSLLLGEIHTQRDRVRPRLSLFNSRQAIETLLRRNGFSIDC